MLTAEVIRIKALKKLLCHRMYSTQTQNNPKQLFFASFHLQLIGHITIFKGRLLQSKQLFEKCTDNFS